MPIDTIWTGTLPPTGLPDETGSTAVAHGGAMALASTGGSLPESYFEQNLPENFDTPTAEEFVSWHSAHQRLWLERHGTRDISGGSTTIHATFGTDSDPLRNLTVLLSQDGTRVITLRTQTRESLARLPLADQEMLAAFAPFRSSLAEALNLAPRGNDGSAADIRAELQAIISEVIDRIIPAGTYPEGSLERFREDPTSRGELYRYLFTEQLSVLLEQLDGMAIFDRSEVELAVQELTERFARIERYRSMTAEIPGTGTPAVPQYSNATDGGASVAAAAELFLTIETRIYDAVMQSRGLRVTGDYNGQTIDAPNMVFVFQTLATFRNEAEAEGKSEEMEQNNRLLQDYALMQRLVNETLTAFAGEGNSDPNNPLRFGLGGVGTLAELAALDEDDEGYLRVLAMFDHALVDPDNNSLHPYESEKGFDRPLTSLLASGDSGALTAFRKSQWDSLATDLGEMSKLIGQDTQIRMNELTHLGQLKNRHYELGNAVLSKMTSLTNAILI